MSIRLLTATLLATAPLLAAAQTLTVSTYDSFVSEWGPGPQLEAAFERDCGCDLRFVTVEDGVSILNRARIEGERAKADVLLGLDDGLMETARDAGLVQPHGLDLSMLDPALAWNDDSFVPFDYGYFAFIYDRERTPEPVTSLAALVDSDARVLYQDPRTSTPGQGLMVWMRSVFGDGAAAAWGRLAGHTVTVTKGWWEAYEMFLNGEADYVLSYSTSPAYHEVAEGVSKYRAARFDEGHVAQVEVGAVTRHAAEPELARRFLAFMVSPEAQAIVPVTNWMLPVRGDVELPEAFGGLIEPARIGFSPVEIRDRRDGWLREWRTAAAR